MGSDIQWPNRTCKISIKELIKRLIIYNLYFSFPPVLAMAKKIQEENLNPYLLVHPNCMPDLEPALPKGNQGDFDSVILGDAVENFSYDNLNKVKNTKLYHC